MIVLSGKLQLAIVSTLLLNYLGAPSSLAQADAPNEVDAPESQNRLPQVEPFDDGALPSSQRQGELVPGLGRVMLLKTYIGPKSPMSMATAFYVYAKRAVRGIKFTAVSQLRGNNSSPSSDEPQYQYDLDLLSEAGFDPSKRTIVMIPGYLSESEESWARDATHMWKEIHPDGMNVVIVSWSDSNRGVYSQAVAHTVLVARQVTIFLHYLAQLAGLKLTDAQMLDNLHLIGHSLGAHIAGFVGQDIGGRVGRITGLDPAGPSFDSFPPDQRLSRGDAQLVEVLHTNMGRMKYLKAIASAPLKALSSYFFSDPNAKSNPDEGDNTAWFGIDAEIGHVDYYANNGRVQAGCAGSLHICDHGRAGEIYVDLLRQEIARRKLPQAAGRERLLAFRAESYASFQSGENFSKHCPGLVSVHTHLQTPDQIGLDKCSVPLLDMALPTSELIEELRLKHGIDFEPSSGLQPRPRFYFKTSAGSFSGDEAAEKTQFLSHHYLAKIYLVERPKWPTVNGESVCSLKAQLIMSDGEKVTLDLNKLEGDRRELDLPFLHPSGFEARKELDQLLSRALEEEEEGRREFARLFRRHFPRTVTLSLAQSDAAPTSLCSLAVGGLEVHPVQGVGGRNAGAVYGGRLALDALQLPVVKVEDFARQLESLSTSPSSGSRVLPKAMAQMATRTEFSSCGFGLEAALTLCTGSENK